MNLHAVDVPAGKPMQLLPEMDCLPGRSTPIPNIPSEDSLNLVLHTKMWPPWPANMEVAAFGMGCVWCTESVFLHKAPSAAIYSTQCGYANGVTCNPTNDEVHTGRTNHVEVVRVIYDPNVVSFQQLCYIFFSSHDPTTPNQQGPIDIGTEYRSAVLCTTQSQFEVATDASKECGRQLVEKGIRTELVITEVEMLRCFFYAEVEHQQHDWRPNVRAGCGLVRTGLRMGVPAEQNVRMRPAASISAAAQRFISQGLGASFTPLDLTPLGIEQLRRETWEHAKAGCDMCLKETGAVVEESELGGVAVQWVTPTLLRGPEVLLYFFGGGFILGSPSEDLSITSRLAHVTGRRVCAPYYRRAPEHAYPAACDDALAVFRALSVDTISGVIVVGESAGGNLAMCLAQACRSDVLAVVLMSPWADLTHSGDSHVTLRDAEPTLDLESFLIPAAKCYAGGAPLDSPHVSPLFASSWKGMPPTYISTGTRDLFLSDCVRLSAKLRGEGCVVEMVVEEGMWHVYEWYPEDAPIESKASIDRIGAFLSKVITK